MDGDVGAQTSPKRWREGEVGAPGQGLRRGVSVRLGRQVAETSKPGVAAQRQPRCIPPSQTHCPGRGPATQEPASLCHFVCLWSLQRRCSQPHHGPLVLPAHALSSRPAPVIVSSTPGSQCLSSNDSPGSLPGLVSASRRKPTPQPGSARGWGSADEFSSPPFPLFSHHLFSWSLCPESQ